MLPENIVYKNISVMYKNAEMDNVNRKPFIIKGKTLVLYQCKMYTVLQKYPTGLCIDLHKEIRFN